MAPGELGWDMLLRMMVSKFVTGYMWIFQLLNPLERKGIVENSSGSEEWDVDNRSSSHEWIDNRR